MSRLRTPSASAPARSLRAGLVATLAAVALLPLSLGVGASAASAAEVTRTINVGSVPLDVAVSPDGSRIAVANSDDETVSIIDRSTLGVIATVPVGDRPGRIAFSPDGGTAYALVGEFSSSIDVIDVATSQVVGSIPGVGFLTLDFAVTADGSTAWVAQFGRGGLVRVDLRARAVTGSYPAGNAFVSLVVSTDGSTVFAREANSSTDTNGLVRKFDTRTNTVTSSAALGKSGTLALTPDGSALWATYGEPAIAILDTATNTVSATFPVDGVPDRIAFSPDGATAYATIPTSGSVLAIDTASRKVVDTTQIGQYPSGLALTPDDELLLVSDAFGRSVSVVELPAAPVFTAASPATTATVGQAYSYVFAASGAPDPTFAVASGALPAGLTLTDDGTLSGTPTTAGTSTFTVAAVNGVAPAATTGQITVTVAPVAAPAPAPTPDRLPAPAVTSPTPGQAVTGPVTYRGTGTPGSLIALVSYEGDTPPQSSGPVEDAVAAADPIRVADDGTWSRTLTVAPGGYTTFAVEFLRDADGTVTNSSPASDPVSYTVTAAAAPAVAAPTAPVASGASSGPSATRLASTGSDTAGLVAELGALLAAAGTALTVASRRRRAAITARD